MAYQNISFKTFFEYTIILTNVFGNSAIISKKVINSLFASKNYLIKTKEIGHIIQYFI